MMMTSKGTPKEVIEVPDDDPDDFPDSGPQNPAEAQTYRDKLDKIMAMFSDLLTNDRKNALRVHHDITEEIDWQSIGTRCWRLT